MEILASIAIFVFIVSALPQVWKLIKNKSAKDISIWMSLLITLGNLLMLIRAVSIHDAFFIINYAFQLALWVTIIILILIYRNR